MIARERSGSVVSRMRTDLGCPQLLKPTTRLGGRLTPRVSNDRLNEPKKISRCSMQRKSIRLILPLSAMLAAVSGFCLDSPSQASNDSVSRIGLSGTAQKDSRAAMYAGDEACAACHRAQFVGYQHTGHHLTSMLPSKGSILGTFNDPGNQLKIEDPAPAIGDPGLSYKMERKDDAFFQTATTGFPGQLQSRTKQIGIVIGSGVRGQSYLYWQSDSLFELPVSYWSDGKRWINSPGYRNGPPNFARQATPRCLECHMSYIKTQSPDPMTNRYDKTTLVPGISCETCHGPGAAHIATHRTGVHTANSAPSHILNPSAFSRERQIDLCALCHNGAQQEALAPAFSYVPGTPLDKHLRPLDAKTAIRPDVHANQVGLLERSRCFRSSQTMTCTTCHQAHAPERPAATYSAQCLGCHEATSCGMAKTLGRQIESNCIDCHMPLQQTEAIVSQTADTVIRTTMRTHLIAVYPAEDQLNLEH